MEHKRANPIIGLIFGIIVLLIAILILGMFLFKKEEVVSIEEVYGLGYAIEPIRELLWNVRAIDLIIQASLIFAGVLGILALFRPEKVPEIEAEAETTETIEIEDVEKKMEKEIVSEDETDSTEEE